MTSHVCEIPVCRKHRQSVPDTELCKQCVDRAYLQASLPAMIAQDSSCNVVIPIRDQQRERREMPDDLVVRFRAGETLEKFLEYQSRRHHPVAALQRTFEGTDFSDVFRPVAAQQQRPDTRVDEQAHRRDLSLL